MFFTKNGVRVRSKSELVIAERFEIMGIPFRYECAVSVEWQHWFPDFLVMNSRTGQEYYWEHFGLMSDASYCLNALRKIETFAKQGIIQGKNLIITMENDRHPLNTEYVDALINAYLV